MYPLAASRSQNRPPAKSGADAQWGRPRPYGYLHWVWEFFCPYYYCSPSLTLCCLHTIFSGSGAAIRFEGAYALGFDSAGNTAPVRSCRPRSGVSPFPAAVTAAGTQRAEPMT
jgi:hypothetical protein